MTVNMATSDTPPNPIPSPSGLKKKMKIITDKDGNVTDELAGEC